MIIGCLPNNMVAVNTEWVKSKLSEDSNLQSLKKVSENGQKLYKKSRTNASPESHKRAKGMITTDFFTNVHPLFGECYLRCKADPTTSATHGSICRQLPRLILKSKIG
jgi:ATP-dependent RNA helicase DDX54/DBP10